MVALSLIVPGCQSQVKTEPDADPVANISVHDRERTSGLYRTRLGSARLTACPAGRANRVPLDGFPRAGRCPRG